MYLLKAKRRKYYSVILLSILIFLVLATASVLADGEISMKIDPGYDGMYKSYGTVPINVTITNNSSKDIEGMVYVLADGNRGTSKFYKNVTVAKNTMKEVTLLVSQTMDSNTLYSNQYVYLEVDDKEIAKEKIGGTLVQEDSLLIGVLANDKDTGNFLATSKPIKSYLNTIILEEDNIPSSSNALSILDIIIINDYSLDKLSQEKIYAIEEWVNKGGLLIFGGGPNSQKSIAPISEISPVYIKGYTEIDSLSSLEVATGYSLDFSDSLYISDAEVKSGKILYQEEDTPVFVIDEVNEGKVLYVAYDLADETLATWGGNKQLWEKVFNNLDIDSLIYNNYKHYSYNLTSAAEKIPTINLPNIKTLIIIFAIYIIVVIPLLYFILKRKDKREWSWLFIPVLAIILTVGIFQYGSSIRDDKVVTHNVSLLELQSEGYGKIQTVSAIFAQNSGEYELEIEDADILTPVSNYYMNTSRSMISTNLNNTNVKYENVEFWGYRASYLEKTISDIGQIQTELKFKDNGIIGTITNNTNIDMHDVKLVYDSTVLDLGDDFKAGESIQVNVEDTANGNINKSSRYYIGEQLVPKDIQSTGNIYNTREGNLADMASEYFMNGDSNTFIVAWSEDDIIHPKVIGEDQSNESLTIISSYIDILPAEDGTIYFPQGVFRAYIQNNNGEIYIDERDNSFEIPNDTEIELEFNINKYNLDFDITKVQFYEDRSHYLLNKRVYNWQTEEYDSYKDAFNNDVLENGNINKYISKDGVLKIECSHDYDEYVYIQKPQISVVGKVVE